MDDSIDVGDSIQVKEKETGKKYHGAKIVQFLGRGWIKVRWDWKGWRMGRVHKSWIAHENVGRGNTYQHSYSEENIRVDISLGLGPLEEL